MTAGEFGTDMPYGISLTVRILMVCTFLPFVLGGALLLAGIHEIALINT